jgi:RNA polymerase sigma-70 factor (ECF subfamily)
MRPAEATLDVGSRELPVDRADALDLEQVFARYSGYVARIGFRLLGRPEEVDDLVQDVFLDASRGLAHVREPAAVKGWLATIAVRRARSRLRTRRIRAGLHLDEVDAARAPRAEPAQEGQVLLGEVYRCLDRLPVRDRLAWTLRHLMDEPLERVAELCQCSLATAKRRIRSAHEVIVREVGDG